MIRCDTVQLGNKNIKTLPIQCEECMSIFFSIAEINIKWLPPSPSSWPSMSASRPQRFMNVGMQWTSPHWSPLRPPPTDHNCVTDISIKWRDFAHLWITFTFIYYLKVAFTFIFTITMRCTLHCAPSITRVTFGQLWITFTFKIYYFHFHNILLSQWITFTFTFILATHFIAKCTIDYWLQGLLDPPLDVLDYRTICTHLTSMYTNHQ